jgi:catechol 2,3-dioxygenase-like lactoylglutathione lyase family enzyme
MLHHVSVGVTDMERAARFYDAAMGALGYKRVMEFMPYALAYGEDAQPELWISMPHNQQTASVGNGVHIAISAPSRAAVHAFHEAALAAGGTDDGEPGPRPQYTPEYYGAFVRDPDGNKIEAMLLVGMERMTIKATKEGAKAKAARKAAAAKAAKSAKAKPKAAAKPKAKPKAKAKAAKPAKPAKRAKAKRR